jgi:hypothetical protein
MKKLKSIFLIVLFASCSERETKVDPYDLDAFIKAEALGTSDKIRDITLNFQIVKGKEEAICDAIYEEIKKFDNRVQPVLGITRAGHHAVVPPKSGESAGELAIRRRAIKLYSSYRSSFRNAERECRAIAKKVKSE